MNKRALLEELLEAARKLEFEQYDALDSFRRRARMVFTNTYGAESPYLRELDAIWLVSRGVTSCDGEIRDWARGRAQYVNLLQTMLDELVLFQEQANQSKELPNEKPEEILLVRPSVYGIGVDLKALWRKPRVWLRGRSGHAGV